MNSTSDRTTGVFPEPPATRLPTQTTGTGARYERDNGAAQCPGAVPDRAERRQQPGSKPGRRIPEFRGAHPRPLFAGDPVLSGACRAVAACCAAGASASRNGARRTNTLSRMPDPAAATCVAALARARRSPGLPSSRATVSPRLSASKTVSAAPARSSAAAIPAQLLISSPCKTAQPRRAASNGLCPPFATSEPPIKAIPATRNSSPKSPSVSAR